MCDFCVQKYCILLVYQFGFYHDNCKFYNIFSVCCYLLVGYEAPILQFASRICIGYISDAILLDADTPICLTYPYRIYDTLGYFTNTCPWSIQTYEAAIIQFASRIQY
ncbi:hypothetical protein GYH30_052628 [Glycine max]|uniref:Uncharacterized protein n=1 Tax=Glycine max TaxID=3847 RepID=A0A0R0ETY9_SOYBN|nr:hypothetical protein GYH30_052628 [Glycine max]